jgi:hypothetical protein
LQLIIPSLRQNTIVTAGKLQLKDRTMQINTFLPISLDGAIISQFDKLPESYKNFLKMASALGQVRYLFHINLSKMTI